MFIFKSLQFGSERSQAEFSAAESLIKARDQQQDHFLAPVRVLALRATLRRDHTENLVSRVYRSGLPLMPRSVGREDLCHNVTNYVNN